MRQVIVTRRRQNIAPRVQTSLLTVSTPEGDPKGGKKHLLQANQLPILIGTRG